MSVAICKRDCIIFGDCGVFTDAILDQTKKFKLCIRFDGAIELVEADIHDYWFTDMKFHWHPKQKFNVLDCCCRERSTGDTDDEDKDPEGGDCYEHIVFFIGNRLLFQNVSKKQREYQFVECDYIDGKDKLPQKSMNKLELVVDKRNMCRIGYVLRVQNINKQFTLRSYNAIDVHVHFEQGYYNQAVLYDKVNKNRLVMMGHQNGIAGIEAIPEWIYTNNYDPTVDTDEHEKEYVRDFIKSNLINCEEAKEFYIPPKPDIYTCKICMRIAQEVIDMDEGSS